MKLLTVLFLLSSVFASSISADGTINIVTPVTGLLGSVIQLVGNLLTSVLGPIPILLNDISQFFISTMIKIFLIPELKQMFNQLHDKLPKVWGLYKTAQFKIQFFCLNKNLGEKNCFFARY